MILKISLVTLGQSSDEVRIEAAPCNDKVWFGLVQKKQALKEFLTSLFVLSIEKRYHFYHPSNMSPFLKLESKLGLHNTWQTHGKRCAA